MKIELINYSEIYSIALKSTSITNLIKNLNLSLCKSNVKKVEKFFIDTSFDKKIFNINKCFLSKSVYSDRDKLLRIIQNSFSYSDVLGAYEKRIGSGNFIILKKFIKCYNIDISHFDSNKRFIFTNYNKKISTNEILIENSRFSTGVVRRRILKEHLLEYKCANLNCGIDGKWLGKEISLQLDHINGKNNDHRLENLQFLCPNCHSTTLTWGNKRGRHLNCKKEKTSKLFLLFKKEEKNFLDNELLKFKNLKEILKYFNVSENSKNYKELKRVLFLYKDHKNIKYFHENIIKKNKISEYSIDELIDKIKSSNMSKVAKELNCSYNGLKKYLIRNDINL